MLGWDLSVLSTLGTCFSSSLYFKTLFIYVFEKQSGEREKEISYPLVLSPNSCNSMAMPDQNQEPETPSCSPPWVAGTQIFETFIAASKVH